MIVVKVDKSAFDMALLVAKLNIKSPTQYQLILGLL